MIVRGRIRQWRLLGLLAGASAILVIACTPSGSMPGMRAPLTPALPAAGQASLTGSVSPVTEVSRGCAGQNAEAETATACCARERSRDLPPAGDRPKRGQLPVTL